MIHNKIIGYISFMVDIPMQRGWVKQERRVLPFDKIEKAGNVEYFHTPSSNPSLKKIPSTAIISMFHCQQMGIFVLPLGLDKIEKFAYCKAVIDMSEKKYGIRDMMKVIAESLYYKDFSDGCLSHTYAK